jgi:hypothetical protein
VDPYRLAGDWTLDRRVVDQLGGVYGSVSGELRVTVAGDGLRLAESGVLSWQGSRYPVTRTTLLRPLDGEWWMLFEDGRPFHPWRPGHAVVHPCGADTYHGLVAVDRAETRIRTLWDVRGPAKRQRLITRFRRV